MVCCVCGWLVHGWWVVHAGKRLCIIMYYDTPYIQPYIQADLYTGSVLMHMSVSHHN